MEGAVDSYAWLGNGVLFWVVLAVVLLGVEMFTGTFYLLVLAVAAGMAALAAWLGATLPVQIILALLAGVVGVILIWRWHKKRKLANLAADSALNNMEIGRSVVWRGTNAEGTWQVFYRGALWQARPVHENVDHTRPLVIVNTEANLLLVDNQKP